MCHPPRSRVLWCVPPRVCGRERKGELPQPPPGPASTRAHVCTCVSTCTEHTSIRAFPCTQHHPPHLARTHQAHSSFAQPPRMHTSLHTQPCTRVAAHPTPPRRTLSPLWGPSPASTRLWLSPPPRVGVPTPPSPHPCPCPCPVSRRCAGAVVGAPPGWGGHGQSPGGAQSLAWPPSTPLSPCCSLRRCFCIGGGVARFPRGERAAVASQSVAGGCRGAARLPGGGAAHCNRCMWGRGSRPPTMEGALPLSPAGGGGFQSPSGSAPGLAALAPKSSFLSPKSSLLAMWGGAGPCSPWQPLLPLAPEPGRESRSPPPPTSYSCCAPGSTEQGN